MTTASKPATRPAHVLASPGQFYSQICPLLGKPTTSQFEGIKAKHTAFAAAASPLAYVAYRLATSYRETGTKMQPVIEIGRGRNKSYGRPSKHGGQVPYSRGDVQLTWDGNYETLDGELGLNGALLADLDLALDTDISVRGMTEGWFAGDKVGRHKFARYAPTKGPATAPKFTSTRRIINEIARRWSLGTQCRPSAL